MMSFTKAPTVPTLLPVSYTHLDVYKRQNWNNPEKLRDSLKKIDISAKFLMALINDVLDMSKIESGKMEVMKVDFDLRAMLQEIRVVCQEQANEKEQELQMKVEEGVGQYYTGDSLRLSLIHILSEKLRWDRAVG